MNYDLKRKCNFKGKLMIVMMDVPDSIRDLIIEHHTEGRSVREIAICGKKIKIYSRKNNKTL
jgi:hypothetical protein